MNVIVISPHFPDNFRLFSLALSKEGIRVFGIDNQQYSDLSHDLKSSLTEYYQVSDLENYEDVLKAVAYFTHKYGKIDRIESHNEHWLMLDAKLREDFNVFGFKPKDLKAIQSKLKMKEVFNENGIKTARGILIENFEQTSRFIKEVNYPVVAKPDTGVGASGTYKIHNEEELKNFFKKGIHTAYVMEEYIKGEIHTFDGLVDRNGHIVYANSFIFPVGVMETVNADLDMIYYTQASIPEDIKEAGYKIVEAFNLKERFFHIEFFRTENQNLYALEINVRPPGGYSVDIFNFANDTNYYAEYAKLVAGQKIVERIGNKYVCLYIGQKAHFENEYKLSKEEVRQKYLPHIVFYGEIASIFAKAIGNYAYILKGQDLDELKNIAKAILEKRS